MHTFRRRSTPGCIGLVALTIGLLGTCIGFAAFSGTAGANQQRLTTSITISGLNATRVAPNIGPARGGTQVTITGTGFTGATAVDFGTTPAPFTVTSDTSITATAPACFANGASTCASQSTPGQDSVPVTVTTPQSTSVAGVTDVFTYVFAVPVVTGVLSSTGSKNPDRSTALVTITGTGFTGATDISFGQVKAVRGGVDTDTVLTVTPPPQPNGVTTVDVTVTGPGGTSAVTPADQFTYGPYITHISPNSGQILGGTMVHIQGIGFTGATAVDFGATPATSFSVTDAGSIVAVNPNPCTTNAPLSVCQLGASGQGTVPITVVTPTGTSILNLADQFTYVYPVPFVLSSAETINSDGSISESLTGTGFIGVTGVDIGGVPVASFTVNSVTGMGLRSQTDCCSAGAGYTNNFIAVTTPGGTSAPTSAAQVSYGTYISRISPNTGSTAGGTAVTITGTGFTGATGVDFGTIAATNFVVNSDKSITVIAPHNPINRPAYLDITVTGPGGTSPLTTADVFSYVVPVPVVSSISPNVGTPAGGTSVSISGVGFTGATTVSFGAIPATQATVSSNTSITAIAPAGTPMSVVDVTVTSPGGTSSLTSSDLFGYGPIITSVTPNVLNDVGGTLVTIKGAGFTGASAVNFGTIAIPSTGLTVNPDGTKITVTSPPGAAGSSCSVTVTVKSSTTACSGGVTTCSCSHL